jgi:hypothetical protein
VQLLWSLSSLLYITKESSYLFQNLEYYLTDFVKLCFWSHPPGIPHEAIMAHLERIAKQIMPAIKNVAAASADA